MRVYRLLNFILFLKNAEVMLRTILSFYWVNVIVSVSCITLKAYGFVTRVIVEPSSIVNVINVHDKVNISKQQIQEGYLEV
jgi:hypothetical protein